MFSQRVVSARCCRRTPDPGRIVVCCGCYFEMRKNLPLLAPDDVEMFAAGIKAGRAHERAAPDYSFTAACFGRARAAPALRWPDR